MKALAQMRVLRDISDRLLGKLNLLNRRLRTSDADPRGHRCLLVGVTAMAAIVAGSASAQVTDPIVEPTSRPVATSGQSGLAEQFSVSPTINALYDSNVLRLNDLRSASGARDDVRITPAVAFDVRQQFARNSVSVSGSVGYDFYQRFNILERLRADVSAGAKVPVSRCQVGLGSNIQVRQAEIEDLDVQRGSTLRILTGNVTARCKRSAGFYPVVGADVLRLTNSGVGGLNRTNLSATGGLVYARPSLGEVQLFVNAAKYRQSNILVPDNGVDVVAVGLQFDRSITSRFAARVVISGIRATPSRGDQVGFRGINYIADLRIAPIPSLILSPVVSRQVSGTINTGANFVLIRDFGISLDWSLGPRTGITARAARSRRRYFGEDLRIRPQLRIADSTDSVGVGVRYSVRALRFGLGASYRERDGRNDFYDFAGTQVDFSARAVF